MNYRCVRCEHKWSQPLGPSKRHIRYDSHGEVVSTFARPDPPPTACPSCGHPDMVAVVSYLTGSVTIDWDNWLVRRVVNRNHAQSR